MSTRNMLNPITVAGSVCPTNVLAAGVAAMRGEFTNMDVAGALGRADYFPLDLWHRQEVANRLLQRIRKMGLIEFKKGKWREIKTPPQEGVTT